MITKVYAFQCYYTASHIRNIMQLFIYFANYTTQYYYSMTPKNNMQRSSKCKVVRMR